MSPPGEQHGRAPFTWVCWKLAVSAALRLTWANSWQWVQETYLEQRTFAGRAGYEAFTAEESIGPGRGGSRLPPLPQIRTCPIKASGSSGYGFAAHGDAGARGHGSGSTFSNPFSRDHGNCPRRLRRDSHFRHRRTTSYRKRCRP